MDVAVDLFEQFARPETPRTRAVGPALRPDRVTELKRHLSDQAAMATGDDPNVARLPWPDEWFEVNLSSDAARCRALWCGVLAETLRAMLSGVGTGVNYSGVPVSESWLDSRDFRMICSLIGVEPMPLAEAVRAALPSEEARKALARRLGLGHGRL